VLAGVIFILPKIGPLKLVAVKVLQKKLKPSTCTVFCSLQPRFDVTWCASRYRL